MVEGGNAFKGAKAQDKVDISRDRCPKEKRHINMKVQMPWIEPTLKEPSSADRRHF